MSLAHRGRVECRQGDFARVFLRVTIRDVFLIVVSHSCHIQSGTVSSVYTSIGRDRHVLPPVTHQPPYFLRPGGRCRFWRPCSSYCWPPPCCCGAAAGPAGAQDGYQPDPQVVDDVWRLCAGDGQRVHPRPALDAESCTPSARWRPCPPPRPGTTPVSTGQPAGTRWLTNWLTLEAQDDYVPDQQVVDDVWSYARETDNGFDPRPALDAGAAVPSAQSRT